MCSTRVPIITCARACVAASTRSVRLFIFTISLKFRRYRFSTFYNHHLFDATLTSFRGSRELNMTKRQNTTEVEQKKTTITEIAANAAAVAAVVVTVAEKYQLQ